MGRVLGDLQWGCGMARPPAGGAGGGTQADNPLRCQGPPRNPTHPCPYPIFHKDTYRVSLTAYSTHSAQHSKQLILFRIPYLPFKYARQLNAGNRRLLDGSSRAAFRLEGACWRHEPWEYPSPSREAWRMPKFFLALGQIPFSLRFSCIAQTVPS